VVAFIKVLPLNPVHIKQVTRMDHIPAVV